MLDGAAERSEAVLKDLEHANLSKNNFLHMKTQLE